VPSPGQPLLITQADRDAIKAWVNDNPLRAWRHAQQPRRLSILEAAELVGVGMSMIQMYERGVHKPGPSKTERLASLLGPDWSERWDAWLAARPSR
jgi:transcriptional regulator with XRE-family HTH domain